MPQNKYLRILVQAAFIAAGIIILFLSVKYLIPWLLPFLLAFLTAALIEPAIRLLVSRFRIKRAFASAACSLVILALVCGLFSFMAGRAMYELSGLVHDLPELLSGIPSVISSIEARLDRYIVSAPPEIQAYLENAIANISAKSAELPAALTEKLLALLSSVISSSPAIMLFAVTYIIAVFFISGSYGEIKSFIMRQIPRRHQNSARSMKTDLTGTLIKWLKAQILIMCITFLELTLAFLLMRMEYAAFLALFTSVVDALPVFGVGTVLLPWAAIAALTGKGARAAALLFTYLVITVVRNFLQPRLVGGMLGVHPVPMLIAIYVGFCAAGVGGMLIFPIFLIMLKQLSDSGYIKLWK